MIKTLSNYIPEHAVSLVNDLIKNYPAQIKIVNQRVTKHGDFKVIHSRLPQITINNNLNEYQFLLTLIHEFAHLVTFKFNKKNVKPHGPEWKQHFQHLMLPFLQPDIFPSKLLPYLAYYLKNPKASTNSDVELTYVLKQYDVNSGKSFIFELNHGSNFIFKNKTYIKGSKRRTRYECVELCSNRIYLFNQNAEVEIKQDYE